MVKKLLHIRISVMAWILFLFFLILVGVIHQRSLTAGQLALFSVNSFLFGYYFNPLLDTQKSRVASLISVTRSEEMTILDILTQAHMLNPKERHILKVKLRVYLWKASLAILRLAPTTHTTMSCCIMPNKLKARTRTL